MQEAATLRARFDPTLSDGSHPNFQTEFVAMLSRRTASHILPDRDADMIILDRPRARPAAGNAVAGGRSRSQHHERDHGDFLPIPWGSLATKEARPLGPARPTIDDSTALGASSGRGVIRNGPRRLRASSNAPTLSVGHGGRETPSWGPHAKPARHTKRT